MWRKLSKEKEESNICQLRSQCHGNIRTQRHLPAEECGQSSNHYHCSSDEKAGVVYMKIE